MDRPEWWGHSAEHGWVVTDQVLRFAHIDEVAFFRCADASVVYVQRNRVGSIVHGPRHYEELPEPERTLAKQGFQALRAGWLNKRQVLDKVTRHFYQAIEEEQIRAKNHQSDWFKASEAKRLEAMLVALPETRRRIFNDLGMKDPGVRRATRHRTPTQCYSCKQNLNTSTNLECITCGWMVCYCGACKCGTNF